MKIHAVIDPFFIPNHYDPAKAASVNYFKPEHVLGIVLGSDQSP